MLRISRLAAPSWSIKATSLRPLSSSQWCHHFFSTTARSHSDISSTKTPSTQHQPTPPTPPLSKVLIANRGEIACRVIRTCRELEIPTVALYSSADGPQALHAQMADEKYEIGHGPHPTESYLLQDQVLEIAKDVQDQGLTAIHPGYGFLSENENFCQKVMDTPGLTWVGPPPAAISAMGSKSQSKAIMEEAGVPTTPGFYGDDPEQQTPEFLLERAREVGFPLLIKAIMGGGGKGMRVVQSENEFLDKLQACQRESLHSFADDRVLLEKYLVNPRHVEVQVVADSHGNVVHLYERDCSLQRRHQKIIEEAPASDLPNEIRQMLGDMGTKAAQAVGYVNAGTVEFLSETAEPDQFYFCEMNTRLQVEHPITEFITGVDLVEWQLKIAAGEPLPIADQTQIPCRGNAFEARIYAENPARNFLPATGKVWHHVPPATPNTGANEKGIRVDTGLKAGQEVGVYYDPMICKLIVHDENREKALDKLVKSLKDYQIAGVPTNIDFLVKCAQHRTFQKAGAIDTGFLDDHGEDVQVEEQTEASPMATAIGVFASLLHLEGRVDVSDLPSARRQHSPWSSLSGSWQMNGLSKRVLQLDNGEKIECTAHRDGSYDILVGDGNNGDPVSYHIDGGLFSNGIMEVVVNGNRRIPMTTAFQESQSGQFEIRMWPDLPRGPKDDGDYFWEVNVQNPNLPSPDAAASSSSGHGSVSAPMPGTVSKIHFGVGDIVEVGDVLLVMEAMKMEHAIEAPTGGVVTEIKCSVDNVVQDGALLVVIESSANLEDTNGNAEAV